MKSPEQQPPQEAFRSEAARPRAGFFNEYLDFILSNKKWWLIPIILGLMLIGGFILLGGTSMAPLIYALF